MHGRHLILPHHHHVHLRSAGQEHHSSVANPNCSIEKMSVTQSQISIAIEVSNQTRHAIFELLEKWLLKHHKLANASEAATLYALHNLNLEYPLSVEANNTDYDGQDTQSPREELPRIYKSLNIVHHLMQIINKNLTKEVYDNFFKFFTEKINHNRSVVSEMIDIPENCWSEPKYTYNKTHDLLEYAVVNESMKLLKVIEKKYRFMQYQIQRQLQG
ncbi:uncharacterized protein LOC117789782 isoform X2 [Drosophila innubila]|nr:uncharacterized protein LOC117789782 isoform X2 [Drosophila innubila]XP_034484824.1 uncharacterized protein LOC117789782 isoform X2 [Drosophila innubila]